MGERLRVAMTDARPVLLTGATGMLGSQMLASLGNERVVSLGRKELDITRPKELLDSICRLEPRLIINCAAHVNADVAEADPDLAYAPNAMMPSLLANAARRIQATLVHFSSTGCYGDWKDGPYDEEDPVRPTTVHHKSKVAGENMVRDSGCEFLIIRTGWLFGGLPGHAKNFVWRRLEEAVRTDRLTSDLTQRGCPTFVDDLIDQVHLLVRSGVRGLYNVVGGGTATRFEYVSKIVEFAGCRCEVIGTDVPFKRPAPVSPNETAINHRLALLGLDRMPHWEQALGRYLDGMSRTPAWQTLMRKE